jgi:hypothetical protein
MARPPQRAGSMRRTILSCACPQNQEEEHCTGGAAGNVPVSLQATMNQLPPCITQTGDSQCTSAATSRGWRLTQGASGDSGQGSAV